MLTPQKIQDLADPLESIYIHMADALLVNIGKHITSPTWTHTAAWEIQKLSELGQLTQENAAIINACIKQIPAELRATMEDTRKAALDSLERQMEQAAKDGYVTPPVADSTVQVFQDYAQQAADRMNLVNTTMLQSSVEQYQRAVMLTVEEQAKLEAQRAATQTVLNEAAGNVASGVETRNVALRRAIKRISDEGLTGFIDRAGHHWTPEAYVNMDIRTTVHNTAIQATRSRMQDYGTEVFQVSSHAGARPGCYPYQGKFYSWDNSSGAIALGNGDVVDFEPLNSTTYGQPAGLFGINCGHYPIPIVPGVTIPHGADNIQPEEENNKTYSESQEQRALERKIREAKRVVEMAGDTATPEDKARVKELQGQMREFIARTGRTRRYDREQIGGTPQTARTPQAATMPENVASQATAGKPQRDIITFTPAKTIQEAEEFARDVVGIPRVSFKGVDVDVANAMNESLTNAFNYSRSIAARMNYFGSAQERNKMLKADLTDYWTQYFIGQGTRPEFAAAQAKKWASAMVGNVSGNTYALAYSGEINTNIYPGLADIVMRYAGIGVNTKIAKSFSGMEASVKGDVSTRWHPEGTGTVRAIFDHEFGHQLDYAFDLRDDPVIVQKYGSMSKDDIGQNLSRYGAKNIAEYIAEAYSEYVNNPEPREIATLVGGIVDREANKQ